MPQRYYKPQQPPAKKPALPIGASGQFHADGSRLLLVKDASGR
jgi:hypothetical protein